MSRIGKKPVPLPKGVTAVVDGKRLTVKGPKGELARTFHNDMVLKVSDVGVTVERPSDASRHKALHGLSRSLVRNMVEGVVRGYMRQLEIHGVGYKAESTRSGVRLSLGFSHPVEYSAPRGVTITVETPTSVKVEGIDKELVGQVAAELRMIRPPEPYKGKGVRYVGEHVRRKAGKTGG